MSDGKGMILQVRKAKQDVCIVIYVKVGGKEVQSAIAEQIEAILPYAGEGKGLEVHDIKQEIVYVAVNEDIQDIVILRGTACSCCEIQVSFPFWFEPLY